MRAAFLAALVVVPAFGVLAGAEQQRAVPAVTLSGPGAEFPVQFTDVSGIRELRDGRVVVADPCEKTVSILNFSSGSVTNVGREGMGPGEFQLPHLALRSRGDTTLIFDLGGQDFLKVSPAGTMTTAASPEDRSQQTGRLQFTFQSDIASDTLGRIYYDAERYERRAGRGGISYFDSAAIVRFDPRSARAETVAFYPLDLSDFGSTGMSGVSGRGAPPVTAARYAGDSVHAFNSQARWTVAPDGRVLIVTPEPFAITWIAPDGTRSTPRALAYSPIRVTSAEKAEAMNPKRESRGGCSMQVTRQVPGAIVGSFRMQLDSSISGSRTNYIWPEFKDPYLDRDDALFLTPAGEIMVLMSRAAGDSVPTYNIYDRNGVLQRRLSLLPGTRLLGFGNGTLYITRNDATGLQYISRYSFR